MALTPQPMGEGGGGPTPSPDFCPLGKSDEDAPIKKSKNLLILPLRALSKMGVKIAHRLGG